MITASPIAEKIYAEWRRKGMAESPRRYLGASTIGHDCDMNLWLEFRGIVRPSFDGRQYRLFDRGKREEAVFCEELRSIGCEVKEFDDDGCQFAVSSLGGHFSGHMDAVARGLPDAPKAWHVIEFKTHSHSSYKELVKKGVKKAKPMHYAQMQSYMGLTGMERALYMAVDKDDDSLYCERVEFDKEEFRLLMERAKRVIDTATPEKCSRRPDDFRCKMCPCASLCWNKSGRLVDPSIFPECRNCCHATADTEHEGAKWVCNLGHNCGQIACEDHIWVPALVNAELKEGTEKTVTYVANGTEFVNGTGHFYSKELQEISAEELPEVAAVKSVCPGAKIEQTNKLAIKYKDAPVVFSGTVGELRGFCAGSFLSSWSNPSLQEECGGTKYVEYPNEVLISISGDRAEVRSAEAPF